MGRPFFRELADIESTYEYSYKNYESDVERLSNFLLNAFDKPIIVVGSGGAFSVAKAFEVMYNRAKFSQHVKVVTPLELFELVSVIHYSAVIIISSNGNNNDIVNAYKFANRCSPASLMVLCLNTQSKLKKFVDASSHFFIGHRLPRGKDGYLALNSTLALIVIIAKAFYRLTESEQFLLPSSLCELNIVNDGQTIRKEMTRETLVILHSDFATPVSVDIESKFSEVALGNVMLADYRNFAHGRHFWLSRRSLSTGMLFLVTPNNIHIFEKTIKLIPEDVQTIVFQTKSYGVKGLLELLIGSFQFVGEVGEIQEIDPGKPSVPEFGRKMYNIANSAEQFKKAMLNDKLLNRSVFRKLRDFDSKLKSHYEIAFKRFKELIENTIFDEIVFDYDSTISAEGTNHEIEDEIFLIINSMLASQIPVKIATGRGKSVRVELRKKIPRQYWNRVVIGYYNGGIIGELSDSKELTTLSENNHNLIKLAQEFDKEFPDMEYDLRPVQITIMLNKIENMEYKRLIMEKVANYSELKLFFSEHSIDIIPVKSSKLNIISDQNIKSLCIGDSGHFLGNDYELLTSKYSLSVNHVSSSISSCWNYAPIGLKDIKATLYYLERISIGEKTFTIKVN